MKVRFISVRGIVALICLVLLCTSANFGFAQQPSQTTRPPATQPLRRSISKIVNMPVVYRVPGMDKVITKSDLKYTTANDPNLLMDVYAPPGLTNGERRPAVVFIHGGAGAFLKPKDWGIYHSWGQLVAASGFIGVTFTHRLGYPRPMLAEAASDVTAAINYIRANADTLNIDKDRLCLAAYSAGGPMLSLAMLSFLAFASEKDSDDLSNSPPIKTLSTRLRSSPVYLLKLTNR
jgi:acetyl esterase/lipase